MDNTRFININFKYCFSFNYFEANICVRACVVMLFCKLYVSTLLFKDFKLSKVSCFFSHDQYILGDPVCRCPVIDRGGARR